MSATRPTAPDRTAPDRAANRESGSAVIEFVFVAVVVMVPLIYFIVAVAAVQHTRLAVSNAARDVGRALAAGGPDPADRATVALQIALRNEGLAPSDVQLRLVAASDSCDAATSFVPSGSGSEFAVCIVRHQRLPGVPAVLSGRGVTMVGRYVVHLDDFDADDFDADDFDADDFDAGGPR
jgi:Flp pilus assembly protein TadG